MWKIKLRKMKTKLILYYTYTIQNNTMDKMEGHDGNKKQRLYGCCSNYVLIVDNDLRIYG